MRPFESKADDGDTGERVGLVRKLDSGVVGLLSRVIFTRRKLDVGVVCLLRSPTSLAFIRPPVPPGVRVGRPRVGFILRRGAHLPPCLFATPHGARPNTHDEKAP